MNKKFKTLGWLLGVAVLSITVFYSCNDIEQVEPTFDQNAISSIVTSESAEGLMEFAPQTPNPYTIPNMQIALDSLIASNELNCDASKFNIRVTHKYIKFKPENNEQFETLLDDTTLILFDYPMDRKLTKAGTYYKDPSLSEEQLNFQWTCVTIGKVLPSGVPYDLLADLYLPEEDPMLVQYYETAFDDCITKLIETSMKLTGNWDTTENKTTVTSGGIQYKKLPAKWTPAGNIQRTDNRLIANIPLEGAKIRANRWFETRESITDVNGNFNVLHQFRYDVNYSIKWERNDFDIRSGTFGQAYFNGPKQKGNWNLIISSGKSRHYAHIHRAGIDYFYRSSQFNLAPPPFNTLTNPRCHIAAHDKDNSDKNAVTHPWSRTFSIFPTMGFYNPNRRSDFLYATAIHELAHYAHWGLDKWTFNFGADNVIESWAEGVEWVYATWRYGSYGDPNLGTDNYQERTVGGSPNYTSVVVDLIDDENQRWTRNHNGSTTFPDDRVNGYTIKQIQDAMVKLNLLNIGFAPPNNVTINSMWDTWYMHLRNDYTNTSEQFLDELFDSW